MAADVLVGDSSIHGRGVFAARPFARGESILAIDDSRIVDDDHPLDPARDEFPIYCDYLADRVVLMAPPERHINSSCDPNTFVRTSAGVRYLIALRPLNVGDEVTYDYIINNHGGDIWQCRCGAVRCRGTMPSSFFDLPVTEQRRLRPLLDDWFVAQHHARLAALGSF